MIVPKLEGEICNGEKVSVCTLPFTFSKSGGLARISADEVHLVSKECPD